MLSIGALSRATGVPVETLRTWERRYGFPVPADRVDSGHRRYPVDAVARIRLVVRGLAAGHKPSVLLRASLATLEGLIAVSGGGEERQTRAPRDATGSFVERCLSQVVGLDGEALVTEFERAWNEVGAIDFLETHLGPFLDAVGDRWSQGTLEVGHEHFASEYTREFLAARWRAMADRARGPQIVCATLSGELHVLGLHMVATALALAGARVTFLGAGTPPAEIVRAVKQSRAAAVALSAAAGAPRASVDRAIRALRKALPQGLPILAGGEGFGAKPAGVVLVSDFREIQPWVRKLGP